MRARLSVPSALLFVCALSSGADAACNCAGGTPAQLAFTTGVGAGTCGRLDADTQANFFPLACGTLYFGGAAVLQAPFVFPDMGRSIVGVSACNGTTLTLTGTTPAQAGGSRCAGGTSHGGPGTLDADRPGGICQLLHCTNAGCLFGAPLPVASRTGIGPLCVVNVIAANVSGTADCATGVTTSLDIALSSRFFLPNGDLMSMRCSGGSTAG